MLKWRKEYDTKIFQNDKLIWKEKLDIFRQLVKGNIRVNV